jgi:hypothetical protein
MAAPSPVMSLLGDVVARLAGWTDPKATHGARPWVLAGLYRWTAALQLWRSWRYGLGPAPDAAGALARARTAAQCHGASLRGLPGNVLVCS